MLVGALPGEADALMFTDCYQIGIGETSSRAGGTRRKN